MSDEDPASEFAKELARQLPVKQAYNEIASPGAKQTGQLLEDLVKTLQLALAPIQLAAALQERYRRFLDRSVRRVDPECRVSPAAQIVGPVLEGIRYEPEGTPIDEMFSELLSTSMDRGRMGDAHPAFPIIIKQLSSDEAKILRTLKASQYELVYTSRLDRETNLFHGRNVEVDSFPRKDLSYPSNLGFYFDHLYQLGLAGIFQVGNQEAIQDDQRLQIGTRVRNEYRLTDVGRRFVLACLPNN